VANPGARLIYLVSDDLSTIGCHPVLSQLQAAAIEKFDSIVVVASGLARLFPGQGNIHCIPHGLHRELFDTPSPRPYGRTRTAAVSVGTMLFDAEFFRIAKNALPDWDFHVIGDIPRSLAASNVILHGEMPFMDTIPFIQHADVGIAPYRPAGGIGYVAQSSMKIQQYTYCGLPIVAPTFAVSGILHGHGYTPGDRVSIRSALVAAKDFDRSQVPRDAVLSWDDVARRILATSHETRAEAGTASPNRSLSVELGGQKRGRGAYHAQAHSG
jgi:2-beta-glucuronyltransferase